MSPLEVVAAGPYNLFYSLAVTAAAASMFVAGRRRGWSANSWALAVAAWVAAGMVGAMLPRLVLGELVGYRTSVGAVLFATLILGLIARALRRDTADVLDTTAVAIPLGAAIVRVGCFFAECCQGVATSLPIGIALHADDVPRHPVQIYESALEIIAATLIARRASWARPGRKFATSFFAMCAIRFTTEFVRDNDKFGGLSLAQWIVLPLGALCLILLLSRPRVARPSRVLTGTARQATIVVVGALGIAAMAAGLPALEASLLLMGAALLIVTAIKQIPRFAQDDNRAMQIPRFAQDDNRAMQIPRFAQDDNRAIRRAGRLAPTGLAVLALQMPAISADSTYPRVYHFFGGGANMGFWDAVHHSSDCDGVREDWTRHHRASGASVEAGARQQMSETHGVGIRGRAYYGADNVGPAIVTVGSPTRPSGFSRSNSGVQAVVDADWKWFGVSAGFSAGRFYPAVADDDFGPGEDFKATNGFPAFGMRFGRRNGVSVDMRIGDDSPMWVPGPAASVALAFGDRAGNRLRIGAADRGILIAGEKFTAGGLELMPTFVLQDGKGFQGGIAFRKWFRAAPRPPGER